MLNELAISHRAYAAEKFAADCGIQADYRALRTAGNRAAAAALAVNPTIPYDAQLETARAGMAVYMIEAAFKNKPEALKVSLMVHFTSAIEEYVNA